MHITGPKPRALALLDHANVLSDSGRLDEACAAAVAALQAGHSLGSVRVINRVRSFRANLPADAAGVVHLTDALRAVS